MSKEKGSVLSKAKSWATRKKLFGAQAFLRYVIFRFVENLNQISDLFIFKGGNLLWVYINTPKTTIDLDLSMVSFLTEEQLRSLLKSACDISEDIQFQVLLYKEISKENKKGAALVIGFQTSDGAKNQFEVDLVLASDDDTDEVSSPINVSKKIKCVSVENIISDKLSACHQFGSGNTRMKDFDDLLRLSRSTIKVDQKHLSKILKKREIPRNLIETWITADLEQSWQSHRRHYKDLPEISEMFLLT